MTSSLRDLKYTHTDTYIYIYIYTHTQVKKNTGWGKRKFTAVHMENNTIIKNKRPGWCGSLG